MKKNYVVVNDKSEETQQLVTLLEALPGAASVHLVNEIAPELFPDPGAQGILFVSLPFWNKQGMHLKTTIASRVPVILLVKEYEKFYSLEDFDKTVFLRAPFNQQELAQLVEEHETNSEWQQQLNHTVLNAFYIKYNRCLKRIFFKDLQYVEAWGNYIRIYTPARKFVIAFSLTKLYQLLPKDQFIRVHRSYIVPMSTIHTAKRGRILLGELWVPVSKKGMKLVKQAMRKNVPENSLS